MNLPNKLTLLRIALIPVFLLFAVELPVPFMNFFIYIGAANFFAAYNRFVSEYGLYIAGAVFVLASATDAADGYIARKHGLVTDFGIFLDPIADKLLVTAALIALIARGAIGVWIPVLIISREFIITGLRLLAASKGVVLAAGSLGKAKTAVQVAALSLLLFNNFNIAALAGVDAGGVLLFAAAVLTVVSGADYLYKNRALLVVSG